MVKQTERRVVQVLITVGALAVLAANLAWPGRVAYFTLACLIVAALPWLSPVFKSIKLPGGAEVSYQEVKAAGDAVAAAAAKAPPTEAASAPPWNPLPITRDPGLELVALRVEIERRVANLAQSRGIKAGTLPEALMGLRSSGAIGDSLFRALLVLVNAGNSAAHGATVGEDVGAWARSFGPTVLGTIHQLSGTVRGKATLSGEPTVIPGPGVP